MAKIIILIILLFLLVPIISANDLEISLVPHYYLKGSEVIYTSDIQFTDISFEIIGENSNPKYRILNLSIVDAYPLEFKKALPNIEIDMLRILQEKTLFISQLIDIEDLKQFNQTNISLWVGVEGIHEGTGEKIYSEGHSSLIIDKQEENQGILYSIGNTIWEDSPLAGNLVVLSVIFIGGFFVWKNKGSEKLNKWREESERKRIVAMKSEEGW